MTIRFASPDASDDRGGRARCRPSPPGTAQPALPTTDLATPSAGSPPGDPIPVTWPAPLRDPAPMLEATLRAWGGRDDLWIFGYASLIWNPGFASVEQRPARLAGWHRALKMWSRVNRGTPQQPGLVFALLPGGCCRGLAFRVPRAEGADTLRRLWGREMPTGVYDPRFLRCDTPQGPVRALAFTLSRRSPNFTGELDEARLRHILANARGRYGSTLEYARLTLEHLHRHQIRDRALERLLRLARDPQAEA